MEWVGALLLLLIVCAGGGAVVSNKKFPRAALTLAPRRDGSYSVVDIRDNSELFIGTLAECDVWIAEHSAGLD